MRTLSFSERTKFVDPKCAVKIAASRLTEMGFCRVSKNKDCTVYMKRQGAFKKIRISDHKDMHPNDDVEYDVVFLEKTMVADAMHRIDNVVKSMMMYEDYRSRCNR